MPGRKNREKRHKMDQERRSNAGKGNSEEERGVESGRKRIEKEENTGKRKKKRKADSWRKIGT